ncbi:MAG: sulfotransferase [Arenimonas sp.]
MDIRAQKLWQRGLEHFNQGHMEAAQAHFESFLVRQPGSAPARFRLSLLHARRGRYLAAVALAREAMALESPRIELLAHLARCHLACGHLLSAREMATRAIAMGRDNAVIVDSLAVVMARLDEQAAALELFDQAIALEPTQSSLYFNRALALEQFGLIDAAQRDLEACLARNPAHTKAHWTLARLRTQEALHNHVPRLRARLERSAQSPRDREMLQLALFKELDDLGDAEGACVVLRSSLADRLPRERTQDDLTGELIRLFANKLDPPSRAMSAAAAPIFIFGMPRSGVALLGGVLARHFRIHALGSQPVFQLLLAEALGDDSLRAFDATQLARSVTLDALELGRRYLSEVSTSAAPAIVVCESHPMNFQLAGLIARALPDARMLHLVRDPIDTCVSILARPGGEGGLPQHDPAGLAACYLDYHRLLQHWHQTLPGRIMDVRYESLVEKPEMVLRVVCGFLGIGYSSALRMGLQLHQRSIGRGGRYVDQVPSLSAGLGALRLSSRSA